MFSSYYMDHSGHVNPNKMTEDDQLVAVIAVEDREAVGRLMQSYYSGGQHVIPAFADRMQAALRREFANPKPPKPEEPTAIGAVVEVSHRVYDWARAVLIGNGFTPWYYTDSSGNGGLRKWDDLDVVRVLSEGVVQP